MRRKFTRTRDVKSPVTRMFSASRCCPNSLSFLGRHACSQGQQLDLGKGLTAQEQGRRLMAGTQLPPSQRDAAFTQNMTAGMSLRGEATPLPCWGGSSSPAQGHWAPLSPPALGGDFFAWLQKNPICSGLQRCIFLFLNRLFNLLYYHIVNNHCWNPSL